MTIKIDRAYGHLQSLEHCINIIAEKLKTDLDDFSMVWSHIIVAQRELEMAKYILNNEEA